MKDFPSQYGPWALVTGASSGIGEEFARQLAARGIHLVLAARRKPLLDRLAHDLSTTHGIRVETIQADLSTPESFTAIAQTTKDKEIGLLVNNAGMASAGSFLKQEPKQATQLIELNVVAPMKLAHLFGRHMTQRGKGGMIFVASTLGYQAVPYVANYAASKAYLLSLGEALNFEFGRYGVDVTVLSPGLTDTAMPSTMEHMDWAKMPITMMEVAPVVRSALSSLGKTSPVIPGLRNNVMAFLSKRVMSRRGMTSMFGGMMANALAAESR